MIYSKLVGTAKQALTTRKYFQEDTAVELEGELLIIENARSTFGYFNSVSTSVAGTLNVTSPNAGGSLLVTDLILNTERQTGGTVEVLMTDGTNSVTIFKAFCNDGPANIAMPFVGRWQGWINARIDVEVTSATDCTVALGYTKISKGLPFLEWDANR